MPLEQAIAQAFVLDADIATVRRHGHGLINDTYLVIDSAGRRIILQRINHRVFPHPEWIMENVRVIADHLRRHSPVDAHRLRLPRIIPARDGSDWVRDGDGGYWRAQEYIEGGVSLETLPDLHHAREAGSALGKFHVLLHDLDPARLRRTLPGFHDTPAYFAHLLRAATRPRPPPADRELRRALAFVRERQGIIRVLQQAQRAGKLSPRPIHGDTKLNNFLFHADSGAAISLIDLDTVQPGLVHFDVGDCLRSCANPSGETPADLESVRFDLDIARAVLQGYFDQAGPTLSAHDGEFLYDAIRLIPFELGMRFLIDHLEGDRYFKTDRRGQNLERALVQFWLTASIERHEPELRSLIADLADR